MGIVSDHCEIFYLGDLAGEERETEWHRLRSLGTGGSDLGAILGVSQYTSPYRLWAEKTGRYSEPFQSDAADLGHVLEPWLAEKFAKEQNVSVAQWDVSLQSKENPHALANVDYWIVEAAGSFPAGTVQNWPFASEPPGIIGILECKTSGVITHGTNHKWDNGAIPLSYEAQVIHYGFVSGVHDIWFAALLGGQGFETRHLEWDDALAQQIEDICAKFWEKHIIGDVPPEVDGSDSTATVLESFHPRSLGTKTSHPDLSALADEFAAAKEDTKKAEERQKEVRAKIISIIGDNELGLDGDYPVFSYKSSKDVEFFADKIFAEAQPELYKEFLRTRPGHRTLRDIRK